MSYKGNDYKLRSTKNSSNKKLDLKPKKKKKIREKDVMKYLETLNKKKFQSFLKKANKIFDDKYNKNDSKSLDLDEIKKEVNKIRNCLKDWSK